MRVVVVGARGQLGAAVVHEFRRDHDDRGASLTPIWTSTTPQAVQSAARLPAAPDAIINCAGVQRGRRRRRSSRRRAAHQRHSPFATWRVRPRRRSACSSIAAPTSCSTALATGRTSKTIRRIRAASTRHRSCSASGLRRTRRAGYVLRVESLFGRAPDGPPAKGSVEAIVSALRAGRRAARLSGSNGIADLRAARGARRCAICSERDVAAWPVSLRQLRALHLAGVCARSRGHARRRAADRGVSVADVSLRARRPKYCALSNAKLVATGIDMPAWRDAL